MASVEEVLGQNVQHISPVPEYASDYLCTECFGPVNGYHRCASCHKLFQDAPCELQGMTVPMSIVVNPSPWYSRLKGYKEFRAREYRPVIASVAFAYLNVHRDDIAELLGGQPDFLTFTPSKGRHSDAKHPLRQAVELVQTELYPIEEPLQYVGEGSKPRAQYASEDFEADPEDVPGARIILLEDVFVSGRTCISAAGALIGAGAESVAILPVGRHIRKPNPLVGEDHPFWDWIEEPYDLNFWPRQ